MERILDAIEIFRNNADRQMEIPHPADGRDEEETDDDEKRRQQQATAAI